MHKLFLLVFSLLVLGCTSAPKLDSQKIRPWGKALESEYPQEKAVIAHYHKNDFDLYYLAAHHTETMGSDTLNLVGKLFEHKFNVLLIEPIPYSSGESPSWFVEESKKGRTDKFVKGGESALAVILADEKKIPFFAGEPDHQDIYHGLKAKGYTDEDVVGFYVVRQIPQWIRERENVKGLFERKIPPFILNYCKVFSISKCPTMTEILSWYRNKLGHKLTPNVSNNETAPILGGALFTQKISSDIGFIRDHFTLTLIEKLIRQYKKVAVVYGAGHFVTLRKSFDSAFGEPIFIEDKRNIE